MSKASRPRDLRNHLGTSLANRGNADWCPGCGLHHHVTGEHRADCTKGKHTRFDGSTDSPMPSWWKYQEGNQ